MEQPEDRWDHEEQLLDALGEFGLNRNEGRLYLAAAGRPAMRVAELAGLAEINRPKAYDALRVLVAKGLFVELPGRVARFEAVDKETAVRRLRQQSIREQTALVEETNRLVADLFQRYYTAPGSDDPFDFVELIRNFGAAWARCEAVVAAVRDEVLTLCKLPRNPGAGMPTPAHRRVSRAGVSYRYLYERHLLDDERFRAEVALRETAGEEIRFLDGIAVSMCLVDRATMVLALTPDGVATGPGGTWVVFEHPGLAGLLALAFDQQWATALPAEAVEHGWR
jgi:DNA-binding MarR family transcriptional regulator